MLLRVYSSGTAPKRETKYDTEGGLPAAAGPTERRTLHPGEEYELEGLISDDEETTLEGSHGSRDSAKDQSD